VAVDNIEELITAVMKNDATIAGIVGARIYPLRVPQDADMPAITYQKISGRWHVQMSGPHNMSEERFQINCWETTYAGVKALADAVRAALNGYDSTINVVEVHIITLENETDLVVEIPDIRSTRRYSRALDFLAWYKIN
jgi:hypothetical protein